MTSKIDCSKVIVKNANGKGDGAYANCDIKKDDIVEYGIVRVIDIVGHRCPYVFTWSEDKTKWALGSGCSTFYNTDNNPNSKFIRYFDENRFEIIAVRNISKGEELTHKYKSIQWRECFQNIQSS